jgi:uncharacterized membrane protein YbhN (UPF0104 family)
MEPEAAPEPKKKPRVPLWLKTLLKVSFSAAVIAWFAYAVDVEQLKLFKENASWPLVGLVFVIGVLRGPVGGWRFQMLLRPIKRVAVTTLTKHLFIGMIYNNFLPSSVGGDAVRVILLEKYGVTKTDSATLIFVERIQGLWALWLMAGIAAPFAGLTGTPVLLVWGCFGLTFGLSAIGIAFILKAPDRWLLHWILQRAREAWRKVLKSPREFFLALFGSALFQVSAVFLTWLVGYAFGVDIPPAGFIAVVPLIWLATLIPISFGGVGLREAAAVYLFGHLGVSMEGSLVLALGNYLTILIPGAVGVGVQVFDWARRRRGDGENRADP